MNPIAVFALMVMLENLLLNLLPKVGFTSADGIARRISVWEWIYWNGFQCWIGDRYFASLAVALVHLLLWLLVARAMYNRGIFLKV